MFSKSFARAANRTCASVTCTPTSATAVAAQRSTHRLVSHQRGHQRRNSSSNSKQSSSPSDNVPSGGKPAPAAESAAEEKVATVIPDSAVEKTPKKLARSKRARPAVNIDKQEDQFAGLPAVPETRHLSVSDYSMSQFFSLHRPFSTTTTIPPRSSMEDFASIFEPKKLQDSWANGNSAEGKPEDVVYALRDLFENIETTSEENQDEAVRWEVVQDGSDGVKHLDGPPRIKSLDEMVAQFKPYQAPPPPQPFPDFLKVSERKKALKPKKKRYATTIFLTESTSSNGETTYTASTSPMVQIPEEQANLEMPGQEKGRLPFREQMRQREEAFFARQQQKVAKRPAQPFIRKAPSAARMDRMFLISVKRQRKLKMKKHKYKKLMKRTRNLRRRQDRN